MPGIEFSTKPAVSADPAKPPVMFPLGTLVEVVPSERHSSYYIGKIQEIVWHHKNECWNYYIEENGRKISTRYLECDLQRRPGIP